MACRLYIPKRFILVVLAHFGFLFVTVLHYNLNGLMRSMVNSSSTNQITNDVNNINETSGHPRNGSMSKEVKFDWNYRHQVLLLSAFFFGHIVTHFPGGLLANKYGGKLVFLIGVFITCVLTLLSPLVAETDYYLFVALRIVQGLAEVILIFSPIFTVISTTDDTNGVTAPAMHAVLAQWSIPKERTRMVTYTYAGITSGAVLTYPLNRLLAESQIGWEGAYYTFGGIGLLWCVVWFFCAFKTPNHHVTISKDEKEFIADQLDGCQSGTRIAIVPWNEIFSSVRVWAIIIAHFSHAWVWHFMLTALPVYFGQVLDLSAKQTEILIVLAFVAGFLANLGGPVVADWLIMRRMTVTKTRRLFGILGFYVSALFLVIATHKGVANENQTVLSVVCMVVATGFLCLNNSSFTVNHLDVSPRFAGILSGLTNTAGSLAACTSPLLTTYFTDNQETAENFSQVFLIAAGVAVIGGTFFNCFATGEQQAWNKLKKGDQAVDGFDNDGYDNNLPAYAFYTTSMYL